MRILFTTPILEHPAAGGPQLRIENSIKALSSICELDIVNRDATTTEEAANYFHRYAAEYHSLTGTVHDGFFRKAISPAEKILKRIIDTKAIKQAHFLVKHVDRRQIDVLWFGYGNISYSLIKHVKKLRPSLKVVCDTDSVWSRFILRELPYARGIRKILVWLLGREKEAEERAWVNLCDVTTAVSEVDAQYYRSIANRSDHIYIFSNVIDIDSYRLPASPPEGFKSPSIYLAGSFGHYNSPMDTAARWMLEEVYPFVLKAYPNVHFYIVGRNSESRFGHIKDNHVTVTGRLESVLPYLCNASVALVPLKYESGTRFKILEAGACRVPLVSTSLGAEGIPVIDGHHLLIADTSYDFANAIVRLLKDRNLGQHIANNCHDLVITHYSIESLVAEAKAILEFLNHD